MKNIKSKLFGFVAAVVVALSLPATGHSQILYNGYFNIDWQYNWPLGDSYADKSSGWGMNFEGGYYFPSNVGLGAFIAFHTNNKYIPRQTFPIGGTGAITTDQQHSVFQLPFGVTGRYRFTQGRVLEPYVAVKVGANYLCFPGVGPERLPVQPEPDRSPCGRVLQLCDQQVHNAQFQNGPTE